jgi:hypothetical protein
MKNLNLLPAHQQSTFKEQKRQFKNKCITSTLCLLFIIMIFSTGYVVAGRFSYPLGYIGGIQCFVAIVGFIVWSAYSTKLLVSFIELRKIFLNAIEEKITATG